MAKPPVITLDTPFGPDVDLAEEELYLPDGTRLTDELLPELVDEIRQNAGSATPEVPDLSGLSPEEQRRLGLLSVCARSERSRCFRGGQCGFGLCAFHAGQPVGSIEGRAQRAAQRPRQ